MTRVNVGVDGGKSQLRLTIAGSPFVSLVEGVAHLEGDTLQATAAAVATAWAEAAGRDGRGGGTGGDHAEIDRIVLGLTTLPSAEQDRLRLAELLGGILPAESIVLTGDAVIAHAGAFPDHTGVVLVVGTGIACLGVDGETGRSQRVDGDGFLLGDNGSSFWIGRRGLAAVLAAADGRGPESALTDHCRRVFGEHPDLAAHLHTLPRAVKQIARFAVQVQDAAASGDAVATRIVEEAAEELLRTALAAARVVRRRPAPVALLGRAVAVGSPLRSILERRLASERRLALTAAAAEPLDGACLLAQDGTTEPYRRYLTEWRRPR